MWLKFAKQPTDEELVNGIRLDYPQRQIWENKLYLKFRYLIKQAMWKYKLQEDEASMAYSDAVLAVIQYVYTGRFEQRSSLKTYIYRIYQHKCIDRFRALQADKREGINQRELNDYLELMPDEQQDTIRRLCEKYEVARLKRKIALMDDRCKQIILAWGEGYRDKEIAVNLGYQSAAVAKTSRLRCLQRLKKLYKTVNGLIEADDERAD